jgi:serine protease
MRYILILLLTSSSLFAQEDLNEIYVKLKLSNFNARNNTLQVQVASELFFLQPQILAEINKASRPFYRAKTKGLNRVYVLSFGDNVQINELISQIKSNSAVELVERKRIRKIIVTPNDPSVGNQWFLSKVQAFAAWDIVIPSGTVKVAVVDNAIQTTHPDLAANMLPGYDASDLDNDPNPPNDNFSHGTHVAGIVSAVTNNSIGIASAANNRVKILPIKATPDNGDPRGIYTGYEGIQWAIDNNADIISLSWGGGGYSQIEQDVIDQAHAQGIVVLAAAGNDNNENPSYPASYSHVISVASLDDNDSKSSFSTYGTSVDISAPGRGILSTIPTNQYASFSGTSMATPLVASICGYLLSGYPTLTPDEVEQLIKKTSDDISTQNPSLTGKLGAGRINMYKLIACKNSNLDDVSISANGLLSICQGSSITLKLSSPAVIPASATYQWFKNNQSVANAVADSIVTSTPGEYYLKVLDGVCEINSNNKRVVFNTIYSPTPTVNYVETFYCDTPTVQEQLTATSGNCNFSGPKQFTYSGPVVGFDANEKSGDFPTATVNGLAGVVQNVSVSITWQKKDVFSINSCGDVDAGGIPYNEEVEFKLISPEGVEVVLISSGTYATGTTTSGLVTTVFTSTGTPIAANSLPSSGTFSPAQSFNSLIGELPNGVWTLDANDDSFVDPLCVSVFSVTIETDAPNGPPTYTWWDNLVSGNLIYTGAAFTPPTNLVGNQAVYVQSNCGGACLSPRVKAEYFIRNVPYIVAFPINNYYLTQGGTTTVTTTDSTFTISQSGVNGTTSSNTFPSDSPLNSPITVCEETCYVLIATGCSNGNVDWSDGSKGEGIIICVSSAYNITATCDKTMTCLMMGSNVFEFKNPNENLMLSRRVSINSNQETDSQIIESNQFIETPSEVDYRATKKITLNPGFTVSGNSTFSATISGCPN